MPDEIEILKLACQDLEKAEIPYMLTGSFAANIYAVPRMTRDADIVIELLQPNIEKFSQTFHSAFYFSKEAIKEALRHEGMFNIIHNDTVFKIDFIIRKRSVYRVTEFQRKQRLKIDDVPVWVVSPEDLIISKLYWAKDSASEMQLNDIRNIMHSLKTLDNDYIQKWVKELNLDQLYSKATHA